MIVAVERMSAKSSSRAHGRYETLRDAELIELAKSDRDAFAALYVRHLPKVMAYFVRAVGRSDIAFDLTAETFAAALVALPQYERRDADGAGWLYAIAHNRLIDLIRKNRTEARARERLGMEPIVFDDDGAKVVEQMIAEVDRKEILALLDQLPMDQRDVISARFLQEQDYSEIALDLQCSEMVVRKRVSRALKRLRRTLETRDA